jgi:hypothetical protein
MGQAIEDRARQALGSEHVGPFVEGQVRGDDDRAALVSLGDDLEEQLGAGLAEWYEAQFVDDEEVLDRECLLDPLQAAVVGGLDEFVDESCGGGEADFQALLAGSETEPQRDMRLACTAWSQRDDVLAAIDELAARVPWSVPC